MLFPKAALIVCVLAIVLHLPFAWGATEFLFYPKSGSKEILEQLDQALKSAYGAGNVDTTRSTLGDLEIEYWTVRRSEIDPDLLPASARVRLEWIPNEKIISYFSALNTTLNDSNKRPYNANESYSVADNNNLTLKGRVYQTDAPPELTMICWPDETPYVRADRRKPWYYFEESAGQDTWVYVLDSGANLNHDAFQDMLHPPLKRDDWINTKETDDRKVDMARDAHGSCVASKVAGRNGGVSKQTHLVIVKMGLSAGSMQSAFKLTREHIERNRRRGSAVIVGSFGSDKGFSRDDVWGDDNLEQPWRYVRTKIRALRDMSVPIVVAAGNNGGSVTALPALFARKQPREPFAVIAVAAVNKQGFAAAFSQNFGIRKPDKGEAQLWAPGEDISCPRPGSNAGFITQSGTSFAAPMVAGLIAYFMYSSHMRFDRNQMFTQNVYGWMAGQSSRWLPPHTPHRLVPLTVWNKNDKEIPFKELNMITVPGMNQNNVTVETS